MTLQAQMLWLLRHEWRLLLRTVPSFRWLGWLGLLVVVLTIIGGVWFKLTLPNFYVLPSTLPAGVFLVVSLIELFLFSLMFSTAIHACVEMLFSRGDMDLLLSSPIDSRLVLTSRGLWLAISSFFAVTIFTVPITILTSIFLNFGFLSILITFVALSFMASAFALIITLGLVRVIGAKRTRTIAQVLGVFFGAFMYLATQLFRFVDPKNFPWLSELIVSAQKLESTSFLFIPAKALGFDFFATLTLLVAGVLMFLLSVQLTHRAFLRGATASILGGRVKPPQQATAFAKSLQLNVFRKEWRLVLRDPMLISQTLLQLIYLIPMFLAFFGSSSRSNPSGFNLQSLGTYPLLVVAAVVAGGSLAQNITQIMVGAEDAAELIRMSPTAGGRVRTAKLLSALIPIWGLFIPLILWRGYLEPKHFFILIGFIAVTVLGGLMILWTAKPFDRTDFKQQVRKQPWLVGLALFFLSISWSAALLLPLWLPIWWGLLAATIGLLIPTTTYFLTKGNSSLGY
jgi:ABC-2 type transport system permease protein